jgi:fatty-acid peroxygenase
LDGDAHRQRKQIFMSLMTTERIEQLADLTSEEWRAYLARWERMESVVLFYEVQEILCRAVCAWSGVPLAEREVVQRTHDLAAMVDGAGGAGPRHWHGRHARQRAERWIGGLIKLVRARQLEVAGGSAAHTVAWHREPDGSLLDTHVAAVELINVLRPTVAIAWFVTLAALALHHHPKERDRLQAGDEEYLELFVQEVRRFYPFFPPVMARVRTPFEWRGYRFPKGRRVLLDLYGTNHDRRLWQVPEEFRPDRFRDWDGGAFNFIPQGGADNHASHRCPGEWITIELMKVALRQLTGGMDYSVPQQDLRINLSRMPAIPRSRFVTANVRRK